mmetsp:Transcript_41588/g.110966  ORF Transcript_41588/g.110966 Transcript_41588/m.110966 type:complete len:203 (+) Transcript_41588:861-1469(+)
MLLRRTWRSVPVNPAHPRKASGAAPARGPVPRRDPAAPRARRHWQSPCQGTGPTARRALPGLSSRADPETMTPKQRQTAESQAPRGARKHHCSRNSKSPRPRRRACLGLRRCCARASGRAPGHGARRCRCLAKARRCPNSAGPRCPTAWRASSWAKPGRRHRRTRRCWRCGRRSTRLCRSRERGRLILGQRGVQPTTKASTL